MPFLKNVFEDSVQQNGVNSVNNLRDFFFSPAYIVVLFKNNPHNSILSLKMRLVMMC